MALLQGPPHPFPTASILDAFFGFLPQDHQQTLLIDCDDDREWTAEEVQKKSLNIASYFQEIGVKAGSIVALCSHTTIDAILIYYAAWMAGATLAPINPVLKEDELKAILRILEPKVIYWGEGVPKVEFSGTVTLSQLPPPCLHEFQPPKVDFATHIPSITFTSGTTGIPKPILIKDTTIRLLIEKKPFLIDETRLLLTSPLVWITNLIILAAGICFGKCLIIPRKNSNAEDLLNVITKHKPEYWFSNGATLMSLLHVPNRTNYNLGSLKQVFSGGSLFRAAARRRVNKEIFQNRIFIKVIYGSTELGVITFWPDDIDVTSSEYESVGRPCSLVTLKIVDGDTTLKAKQIGEICIKTKTIMAGIKNQKFEEISEIDSEGWYHTGDIGYYDEKGLLYITDRIKDIFKYKGYQIAPAEIENVLETNEAVLEACVVGVSHEEDGCRPAAAVILKHKSECTAEQLTKYVSERVPDYKKLHGGLIICDRFPRNTMGKILRKEVEKMFYQ